MPRRQSREGFIANRRALAKRCAEFTARVEALNAEYAAKLNALGEEFSDNVLLPLCKAENLWFLSGMGTWYFNPLKGGDCISSVEDAIESGREYLAHPIKVMQSEIFSSTHDFGMYVPDANNPHGEKR